MAFLNRPHRVAWLCGAVPLFLGTAIFLLWLIVRWDWLVIAGGVVLFAGVPVVVVGFGALARFWWVTSRTPNVSPRRLRVATLASAGLLLTNFPVAAVIVWAALAIDTRYTVVVHNASQVQLDRVRVFGGGCDASYGSLPPGATASRSFWIRGDGVIVLRASSGDDGLEQSISSYVTVGGGGHLTVTVEQDKRIAVLSQRVQQLALFDRVRDAFVWSNHVPCVGPHLEPS